MSKKTFCAVILWLLIAFAVVNVGGCGGSNGSLNSDDDEQNTAVLNRS